MTTKPTAQAALTWRAVTAGGWPATRSPSRPRAGELETVELVGEPATLTVGTVTVGAHA